MIEQYSISATPDKIIERFSIDGAGLSKPIYNASPTQLLPVITHNAPKGISTFYWGTSPEWSKNKSLSEKIVNTHVELITERASLKKSLTKTRCLIPADGFFAWKKQARKLSSLIALCVKTRMFFLLQDCGKNMKTPMAMSYIRSRS